MISKKMTEALNDQIALEGYASFLYLSMASWLDKEGLEGSANFMRRQSEEERAHMLRIFDYMSEVDAYPQTPAIEQPPLEFDSVPALFQLVYEHERKVTKAIYYLLTIAKAEEDYNTENFLQWYIEEQREEENLMRSVLDKIRLIGDGPLSLYYIDKEVAEVNAAELKEGGGSEG